MKTILDKIKKENPKFFFDIVIELGMKRTQNLCAFCNKKITFKNYHIQLCSKCRLKQLDLYSKEILKKK